MSKSPARLALALFVALLLALISGPAAPAALAQEATPETVAPPQDLLPKVPTTEPVRRRRSTASTSITRFTARAKAIR
jgi:hypothetical protein